MTDNASEFRARRFQDTLRQLQVRHTRIHAGRPQTNGSLERVQGTIPQECWEPAFARYLILKLTRLWRELVIYLKYYNEERATEAATPRAALRSRFSLRQLDALPCDSDVSQDLGDRTG